MFLLLIIKTGRGTWGVGNREKIFRRHRVTNSDTWTLIGSKSRVELVDGMDDTGTCSVYWKEKGFKEENKLLLLLLSWVEQSIVFLVYQIHFINLLTIVHYCKVFIIENSNTGTGGRVRKVKYRHEVRSLDTNKRQYKLQIKELCVLVFVPIVKLNKNRVR